MELLGPTLTDLENAGKTLGSLDNHYVGQLYPQFKDDLKDLGIADIDIYGAYNLKNVQDDLKHIQSIAYESPSKIHFAKKIEFLVQLSQRTLKLATKAPEDAKKTKKPIASKNGKPSPPLKDVPAESIKKGIEPLQLPALQAPSKQPELKLTPKKMGKIKPMKVSPKKRKDASKTNENIRKKLGLFEGKTLARISEDIVNEEASDLETSMRVPLQPEEIEEMSWKLSPAQQEMVQNTLKKYNMSEDIWTNYILARVHGDAQLKRMGIKASKGKVDCQIETIKFVEELERHMDRKNRALTKRYANNSVTPLQPDQDPQILDFPPQDFFNAPSLKNYSSAPPAQARAIFSSSDSPSPSNRIDREHHSSPVQPLRLKNENISSFETDLMAQVNPPSGTPTSGGVAKNRTLSKMWNPTSTHNSQGLPKQLTPVTLHADCLDNLSGFMNLQDSLQESLTMDQNSTLHYMKSRGQFRLPSISSSNSHMKRFSQTESPMTGRVQSGRKYRPSTDQSARTMTDFETCKTEGSQLDDSLEADSLIVRKETYTKAIKRPFRLSSLGTVRSKYLASGSEASGVLNKLSLKESEQASSLVLGKSHGRARGNKTESDQASFDVRSDFTPSQNELSESLNERSSIKGGLERTMMTVISQESHTKLAFSRASSQIVKIAEMTETEYCGEVKRICLLGSGSEAKVFLCKIKDYEEELALKQYDLVKNQKRSGEPYDGLIKEFEMLKHLDHENIIKYICLYKPKTQTYHNCLEFGIIMEYMPGGSLDTYIEENSNSMTFETKKSIMKQILSGIDFLHQHNIIHRDLKPGNILLSEDKTQVKISDFGISKKTNTDTSTKRTLVGTPWYMAPEVISQEGYSSKADIWSAGCCFFHLLAGQKPYHNANAIQALLLMVNHKSPLETCPPEILDRINQHAGVKEFLELCFNRNKSQRPTAANLLEHPIFKDI